MFNQTWKKYLPIIAILLKRSLNGEQSLKMDSTDFDRAAGGRKMKYSFSDLQLRNGRSHTSSKHTAMAKELALLLQGDAVISKLLLNQDFEFSMTTDCRLQIKNNTAINEATTAEALVE
ncbi:hypothetical protein BH11BAC4_BH11BAC4_17660 [soil metagenome]